MLRGPIDWNTWTRTNNIAREWGPLKETAGSPLCKETAGRRRLVGDGSVGFLLILLCKEILSYIFNGFLCSEKRRRQVG